VLIGVPDNTPVTLTTRLTVVIQQATELLRHGRHQRQADGITALTAQEGTTVVVLAETSTTRTARRPTTPSQPCGNCSADKDRLAVPQRQLGAAKPRKRKIGDIVKEIQPADEPAIAAVRDLFRNAGVIDNRLRSPPQTRNASCPERGSHFDRAAHPPAHSQAQGRSETPEPACHQACRRTRRA